MFPFGHHDGAARLGPVRRTSLMALVALSLVTGACSAVRSGDTVVVSAAASLSVAFTDVAAAFEEAHPDLTVELNIGGSTALREQIVNGAPVDVFASADERAMTDVLDAIGLGTDAVVFATNSLGIAVQAGNPAAIGGLDDFARDDLVLGLCAVPVPCGVYARQSLVLAGIDPSIDTDEPDVRSLSTKIALGEIDAGIVYRTDIFASRGALSEIPIPPEFNVTARYPIASLDPGSAAAAAFVAFVLSNEGKTILRSHGFDTP